MLIKKAVLFLVLVLLVLAPVNSASPTVSAGSTNFYKYSSFIKGIGDVTSGLIWDTDDDLNESSCVYRINAEGSWLSEGMSWSGTGGVGTCKLSDFNIQNGIEYKFAIGIYDDGSNLGYWEDVVTYIGDTDAPTTTLSGCDHNVWYNEDKTITLSCYDGVLGSVSGCQSVYYNINDAGEIPVLGSNWSTTFDEDFNNSIVFRSRDMINNIEELQTQYCLIDKTNPEVSGDINISPANGLNGWYVSDVNYYFTPTDNLSGIFDTEYCLDDENSCDFDTDGVSGDSLVLTVADDGNNYIAFRTFDNATNESDTMYSVLIKMDQTLPTTSGDLNDIPDGNNGWYISDVNFYLTPFDATSGIADTNYCHDDTNSCDFDTDGVSGTSLVLTVADDGNNYISFRSVDVAGNVGDTNYSVLIKMDQTNPVTTLDYNVYWQNTDANLILVCADATSGCYETRYKLDVNTTSDVNFPEDFTTFDTNLLINEDGNWALVFYSEDLASNTDDTNTVYILVDKTAPVTDGNASFAPDGDSNWYVTDVNFVISALDITSGVLDTNYCIDDENTCVPDTNYSEPLLINSDGNYYIRYRSVDNATNLQEIQSYFIKMDLNNPVVDVNSNDGEVVTDTDFNFVFDVNYGFSGYCNASYVITLPDDTNTADDFNDAEGQPYVEVLVDDYNQDGQYALDYNFMDCAGNTTTGTEYFNIDLTSPEIVVESILVTSSSFRIKITSDDLVTCKYDTNVDLNYDEMTMSATALGTSFSLPITGLSQQTTYTYLVQCRNRVGYDMNSELAVTTLKQASSGGGGRYFEPGVEVIKEYSEDISQDTDKIKKALENMKTDDNKQLYNALQVNEILSNLESYSFTRTVQLERITSNTGAYSYKVVVKTTVINTQDSDLEDVKVVLEIPKEIAISASEIESPYAFSILVDDPIVEFTIPKLNAGESALISYSVSSKKEVDVKSISFTEPVVRTATKLEQPVAPVVDSIEPVVETVEVVDSVIDDESVVSEPDVVAKQTSYFWYWILGIGLVVLGLVYYFTRSEKPKDRSPLSKR